MPDAPTDHPFAELPAVLVEEILGRTESLDRELLQSLEAMHAHRQTHRAQPSEPGLLHREATLRYVPIHTTCDVDGSRAIGHLLTKVILPP